eukprot:IDg21775t1
MDSISNGEDLRARVRRLEQRGRAPPASPPPQNGTSLPQNDESPLPSSGAGDRRAKPAGLRRARLDVPAAPRDAPRLSGRCARSPGHRAYPDAAPCAYRARPRGRSLAG